MYVCVTLDHKTSLKSLVYLCSNSNSQNYKFLFYAKYHKDFMFHEYI